MPSSGLPRLVPRWPPPTLARYILGVLLAGAALAVTLLLEPWLTRSTFLLFAVAVVGAAWIGGTGPALLATLVAVAGAEFLLLSPAGTFRLHAATDLVALGAFGLVSVGVGWLAARTRRAMVELEERSRQLQVERATAEEGMRRAALLAEAARIMTASLDYETAFEELARFACREMADYCITYVAEDDHIRRIGAAHADPEREPLIHRLLEIRPPSLDDPYGAGMVVRTGEAVLATEIPADMLRLAAAGPEHLAILEALAPVSSMVLPLQARGRTVGAIAFATTDRSERRYEEPDLAFARELASRAALALDNARLYREVQRAVRVRDEFLAVVAHELRSPLNTVATTAALLDEPEAAAPPERLAALLRTAVRRSDRLIRDLLDISRMEAGRFEISPEPLDIQGLLAEACAQSRLGCGEREVDIEHRSDGCPPIAADRARVLQVLSNLIDNAVAVSPSGERVSVVAREEGEWVEIAVVDRGPGIREEDLPRLFERFWQGESRTGGAGLGLAIVRGIVEAHGGDVRVESRPGEGATFRFRLPAAPADVTSVPSPPSAPRRDAARPPA